jgi:hypothetical protein
MANKSTKSKARQRRTVSLSISAPVSVTLIVERDMSDPDEPGEWDVVDVRRVDCELSARGATECMADEDFAELDRLATAAPDENA